jgi:hypothetical protein
MKANSRKMYTEGLCGTIVIDLDQLNILSQYRQQHEVFVIPNVIGLFYYKYVIERVFLSPWCN